MPFIILLAGIYLLGFFTPLNAQTVSSDLPVLELDTDPLLAKRIGTYGEFFIEVEKPLSLNEALNWDRWQPIDEDTLNHMGRMSPEEFETFEAWDPGTAIWIRFKIINHTPDTQSWRLDLRHPIINDADVYAISEHFGQRKLLNYQWETRPNRPVKGPSLAVDIDFAPQEVTEVYIRYRIWARGMSPIIGTTESYRSHYAIKQNWEMVFLGSMTTIIGLALVCIFIIGRQITLSFCIYMIAGVCMAIVESGTLFGYIVPDNPKLGVNFYLLAGFVLLIAQLNLGRSLFEFNRLTPYYDKFLKLYMTHLFIVGMLAVIIGNVMPQWLYVLVIFTQLGGFALHVINSILATYLRRKGALIFAMSGILILGTAFYIFFIANGKIDITPAEIYRPIIILEALIFAAAVMLRTLGIKNELSLARADHLTQLAERLKLKEALLEKERDYDRAKASAEHRRAQLASVSHDILQPLTSLRSALGSVSYKDEEKVQAMHEAFDYLETLATESLKTDEETRPDTPSIRQESFNLRSVTDNVFSMFEDEARAKSLNFTYQPYDVQVYSRPLELMRVISNLVSNAIKYTEMNGDVQMVCHKDDDKVSVTIIDTGPGMSADELEAMQQKGARGARSDGAGLGLALCFEICEHLGHKFELTSEAGRGTTARIEDIRAAHP